MERLKLLEKYKYALLILAVGIVLMLLPQKEEAVEDTPEPQTQVTLEERLEAILSRVDGAGEVKVLLTEAAGSETLYQTDETDTVILTDSQRSEEGLVRRRDPPEYLGAIIVCKGADDARVKLAIVEAVSDVTGLGADKISVIKMK